MGEQGGIIEAEAALYACKVQLVCPKCGRPTRVGHVIENGKKTTPVDLITIGGNLIDLFNDVIEVGGDVKHLVGGVSIPSLVIKSIKVSGK